VVPGTWSHFVNGGVARSLMLSPPRVEVLERSRTAKADITHVLTDDVSSRRLAEQLAKEWLSDRFEPADAARLASLKLFDGECVNELPSDATYFIERKRGLQLVHAFALRDRILWLASGWVNGSFGTTVGFHHHASRAEAKKAFDEWITTAPALEWKPISHPELVALYAPSKGARASGRKPPPKKARSRR